MAKKDKKKVSKNHGIVILAACVAVCAAVVLFWIIAKEVYLAETKSVRENAENIVINNIGASSSLVNAILSKKSGCPDLDGSKNIVYIVKETDDFAFVRYGCAHDAEMFYKKVDGKWQSLSPTNQFFDGVPFCRHLKKHSIPKSVAPICWEDFNPKDYKMPPFTVNPVGQ